MNRERRMVPAALAGVGLEERAEGPGRIVGYASVTYDGTPKTEFRIEYGDGETFIERIMPGAFLGVLSDDVRGLKNHDANLILGRTKAGTMTLAADERGLRFEIDTPDTTTGRDTAEEIRRGDLSGCSFAFSVDKDGQKWIRDGELLVREVRRVKELFDVGPVTYPAYTGTTVDARSAEAALAAVEEERAAGVRVRIAQAKARARAVEVT